MLPVFGSTFDRISSTSVRYGNKDSKCIAISHVIRCIDLRHSVEKIPGFASARHLLESGSATLYAGHKHNIYSITTATLNTPAEPMNLLAVAGKNGMLSLYNQTPGTTEQASSASENARVHELFGSFKVHSRWIAEVRQERDTAA